MKKINKKGFTLIELLAVIVILAVIALIVTPIVTGIISDAKESANARSVEGHISDVNYAIMSKTMLEGNSNAYDGTLTTGTKYNEILAAVAAQNSADTIKCTSYTISNGNVTEASGCNESKAGAAWSKAYSFKQGENAKQQS